MKDDYGQVHNIYIQLVSSATFTWAEKLGMRLKRVSKCILGLLEVVNTDSKI